MAQQEKEVSRLRQMLNEDKKRKEIDAMTLSPPSPLPSSGGAKRAKHHHHNITGQFVGSNAGVTTPQSSNIGLPDGVKSRSQAQQTDRQQILRKDQSAGELTTELNKKKAQNTKEKDVSTVPVSADRKQSPQAKIASTGQWNVYCQPIRGTTDHCNENQQQQQSQSDQHDFRENAINALLAMANSCQKDGQDD